MSTYISKYGFNRFTIVSGNGTVTEIVSSFVDHFLKPLVPTLDSYIQDSTHFLRILEDLKTNTFPQGTILGTLDVKSLYTNIPHTEGLEANRARELIRWYQLVS